MTRHSWVVLAGLWLGVAACALGQENIYVAANGNDAWSGRLAEPNAEKTDGPFATLERARDAVRALKKAGQKLPKGGVEVRVREGVYEVTSTFKLTEADSGTEAAPVVYRAFGKEKPVLIGGRKITGFQPYKGEILKADVGAQGFKGVYFRQLYYNGQRQQLARYPNFDPKNPHGGGYAYVEGEPGSMYKDPQNENLRVIQCKPRNVRTWEHPEGGEVCIFPRYNWHNWMIPIASVDREKRTITLTKDAFKGIRPLDRYYVRNLPEELDAPGEWYLDKATWTLYFWPPGPTENASVYAPTTENLIEVGPNAAWITIRGFTMECCEANAVFVSKSENCLVAGNTIHNTGGRLGYTVGVFVDGGRKCGVAGNDIFDVSNGGIRLQGGDANTLTPADHYADNNYVHHIGVLNGHGCGIWLSGVALRVSRNLIHDTTRCGIFGGGTDCVVEYNHIRHTNLETEDTGAYYNGGCWHIRGQVVRYNYVHDVLGYGRSKDKWVMPYFCWGIYLDDDQCGTHVYGNIVARTYLGGCHVHAGRDNVIENNIFVENLKQQMQYSGHDPKSEVVAGHLKLFQKFWKNPAYAKYPEVAQADLNTLWHMAGNKFRRNIIYYRDPKAKLYQYGYQGDDVPEQNESDYNLIWHFGLPLEVGMKGLSAETSWEGWKKRGFDTHSVVADPLFVDPEKDDYRLRADSPALKLGFEPIPVEKIGPYQDELRATWPIVEAEGVREHPLPAETPADIPPRPVKQKAQAAVPKRTADRPEAKLLVNERPDGEPIKTVPCEARIGHDDANLYVAMTVPVSGKEKMKLGEAWGESDAVEVCFQDLSGLKPGPIFVLHGFATGKHESVTEAGATPAAAQQLHAAVKFAARIMDGQWVAEWAIPLPAAGISCRPGLKLGFNLGIRRSENDEWIQWSGSGSTWNLPEAGVAILE